MAGQPPTKKANRERTFLFSSESVNEGHPDKLCDQVSDGVLDTCLRGDPKSKGACETATKDNMVMVAGEITTGTKIDYDKVVRGVVEKIGYNSYIDDLASTESKGLDHKNCEVLVTRVSCLVMQATRQRIACPSHTPWRHAWGKN